VKRLPIGISDFKKLREENYIYIDKTQYIYKLIIEGGGYYFLSRPRRFGKSLLISTIRYLFEGKKDLFKDLYIYDKFDWDKTYPVVRISFAKDIRNKEDLRNTIYQELEKNYIRNKEKLPKKIKDGAILLEKIIVKISEKKGKQVVILVDEYDKPILDVIEDKKQAEEVRKELKSFYSVIKNLDEYIKFLLITGVIKFSKVSLFSGLNQLKDISLDTRYGNICGYTQEELENNFKEYLEGVNLEEVREWYNGYSFLGERLYNPFDILLYLDSKKFKNYWYKTGTPSFLIKLIKKRQYDITKLENMVVKEDILEKFDLEEIRIEALMYQTGYLTIKEAYNKEYGEEYRLGFPNKEVRISFNEDILPLVLKDDIRENIADKIIEILKKEEIEKLREQVEILISNISYVYFKEESSYVIAVFSMLYSTGLNVITEDNTSKGRIDLTIIVNNSIVYIMEFKVIQDEKEKGKAIKQILQKEYYKKYLNYEKIYLIGIELDKTKKQIANFEYQQVK
jgi:hypothetical protein